MKLDMGSKTLYLKERCSRCIVTSFGIVVGEANEPQAKRKMIGYADGNAFSMHSQYNPIQVRMPSQHIFVVTLKQYLDVHTFKLLAYYYILHFMKEERVQLCRKVQYDRQAWPQVCNLLIVQLGPKIVLFTFYSQASHLSPWLNGIPDNLDSFFSCIAWPICTLQKRVQIVPHSVSGKTLAFIIAQCHNSTFHSVIHSLYKNVVPRNYGKSLCNYLM